jgi:MoxR-like ATPase
MSLDSALTRLREIAEDLNNRFPCREDEIMGSMLCLLTGELKQEIGRRGDGKTALSRALTDYFTDATFFMCPLSKGTTLEDLFGGPDIVALKNNKYRRATDGKTAKAHIILFDEYHKGSEGVLQSLLNPLSERIFEGEDMPLLIATACSNELPQELRGQRDGKTLPTRHGEDSLMPLQDRFILKYMVRSIEPGTPEWKLVVHRRVNRVVGTNARISVAEIAKLREQVAKVEYPLDIEDKIDDLAVMLATGVGGQGRKVEVSVRTFAKLKNLLCAYAYFKGDPAVTLEHFPILQHALWNTPDQREVILEAIDDLGSVFQRECAATVRYIANLFAAHEASRLYVSNDTVEVSDAALPRNKRIGATEVLIRILDKETRGIGAAVDSSNREDLAAFAKASEALRNIRANLLTAMTKF